ncbi:MAG: hypothetical protein KAS30_01480 [Candidatus Diapherotrites archaeon]|nr:hypothetical protein [Candidatus Diapherotrites archaeon]
MATNEILKFAPSAISMLSQALYAGASSPNADLGHVLGVADPELANKALKQSSLMAGGLAQFLADNQTNNITDALTLQNIADYIELAIASLPGSAKAWINYKGTATRAIRGQLNFASVTYNSLGNYTFNFTNNMSDTNYAVVHGCADTPAPTPQLDGLIIYNLTVSGFTVQSFSNFEDEGDLDNIFLAVFGN